MRRWRAASGVDPNRGIAEETVWSRGGIPSSFPDYFCNDLLSLIQHVI